jgi:hypothetical protein
MDVPSHADVVAQIDAFLDRQSMKPSRLGRDALGEPQFVSQLRAGRMPGLDTLLKLSAFMRRRDEQLIMASDGKAASGTSHRLNARVR